MSARDRYHREVFWQSYPEDARKRRGTFEQAWASAMKSVDTETMVVALGKQLAVGHLVNDNGYTILPSTWLTSGCWADELAYDASREEAQHALNFEAEHIERLWNEAQAEHAEQQGAKA